MSIMTNEEVITNTVLVDGSAVTQPVSGTVTANAGTGTFNTNGLTDAQLRATPVSVFSTPTPATTSTVTLITSTGSNITLLAANANRKKAIFWFEGSTQYLKLGAGASSTSYTYKVAANNTSIEVTGYTGIIDSTGTSGKNILVTELV